MGELGWTLERWRGATFTEFNYAVEGYWRNWERFAGLVLREVCYTMIAISPDIKKGSKPSTSREFMKLSIDKEEVKAKPTEEDIKKAQEYGKTLLNGKK